LSEVLSLVDSQTRKPVGSPGKTIQNTLGIINLEGGILLAHRMGKSVEIGLSGAPIRRDGQPINGFVFAFRDVSEKRRIQDELLHTRKLEALGLLAGGIAHDFNNLLTAILGNLSLAKEEVSNPENCFQLLDETEAASIRAQELTNQLRIFSKGGTTTKSTIELGRTIKEAALFPLHGSNVKCRFNIASDLWPIIGDSGQIAQVIQNLVINADQAMPHGGILKLEAANCGRADLPDIAGSRLEGDRFIKISVKDKGVGISQENQTKIFDPYFSTKSQGGGLGLSVCYSIVKNHGGTMLVESQLNRGSEFCVYLPTALGPAKKQVEEKGVPVIQEKRSARRILVMDDEPTILNVIERMLRKSGHEAVTVKDGREALDVYKKMMQTDQSFDALILDLTIPGGMGGKEVMERILKLDPDAVGIVSSGYSTDPILSNFREYGFRATIAKPYRYKDFKEVIDSVFRT